MRRNSLVRIKYVLCVRLNDEKGVERMGFLEGLTLVFVILKLVGVIAWSWWIVLLPLIIAAVIYLTIIAINLVVFISVGRGIKRSFDDGDFFN